MAYPSREQSHIIDPAMQAMLDRRIKELIGLTLLAAAVFTALALWSYSPKDPSFLGSAVSAPLNWLGYPGAYLASPLTVILGYGAWSLVAACAVWGIRFLLHWGEGTVISRLLFLPIWVAVAGMYAACYPPIDGWGHGFGMGGLFGDTALGVLVVMLPVPLDIALKGATILLALALLGFGSFSLGFTRAELAGIGRFLGIGFVLLYDLFVRGLWRLLLASLGFAAHRKEKRQARRVERAQARQEAAARDQAEEDDIFDDMDASNEADWGPSLSASRDMPPMPDFDAARYREELEGPDWAEPYDEAPKASPVQSSDLPQSAGGLLARLPLLSGRMQAAPAPAPQVEETEFDHFENESDEDMDEGIKARVSGAVIKRQRRDRRRLAQKRMQGAALPDADALPEPELPSEETYEPVVFQRAPRAQLETDIDAQPAAQIEDETDLDDGYDPLPEDAPNRVERSIPPVDPNQIPRFLATKPTIQHPTRKAPAPSTRAKAEAQPSLQWEDSEEGYAPPPLSLLRDPASIEKHYLSDEALEENARMLENVLDDYGVKGEITSVRPGPVVTMYELEPAPGLKASRVIGLADDIARSMSALSARVSTVPGRTVIGIELPNERREMVLLRELLATRDFGDSKLRLPLALGKDIGGAPIVANLAKMPHLLIAGTTGSGKSVAINTMILSLLYKLSPDECRLIMIDPKMLELSVYDGIPHLLSPVVTDPKKAVVALKWVVGEMEERYRKMSKMGVRNIEGYNGRVREALGKGEMFSRTVQTGFDDETGDPVFETEEFAPEALPYIVVIVDEMADLMMVAGKEIEACIQRLAQMARASGIHLIMATQRPSVDVITGTIKANFPTRISFQVTSKVDSRTILGEQGAEQLLGMGDMLYMAGGAKITRVHGPFASDEEVEEIVTYLKAYGPPDYVGGVVEGPEEDAAPDIDAVLGLGGNTTGEDALYDQAVAVVINDRKCSTSYIQRKLAIGYNK
ncbi:MAG: DNA translocase FtsK, partial [Mangrovicoccus sp.]